MLVCLVACTDVWKIKGIFRSVCVKERKRDRESERERERETLTSASLTLELSAKISFFSFFVLERVTLCFPLLLGKGLV